MHPNFKEVIRALLAATVVTLAAAACSTEDPISPSTPPPPVAVPAYVTLLGLGQTGRVAQPLRSKIGVRIRDAGGRAIPGVRVHFRVAAGGGMTADTLLLSDESGVAWSTWTLGTTVGIDTAAVVVDGYWTTLPGITATAVAGSPAALTVVSGDGQVAMIGMELAESLVVRVTDQYANPVPGIKVNWSSTSGGGWVSGPGSTETGPDGLAGVTRTLGGTAGAQATTASTAGLPVLSAAFASTGTALVSQYDLDVRFTGPVSPAVSAAFAAAAARWHTIIIGDLTPAAVALGAGDCAPGAPAVNETVDDILILVVVDTIDDSPWQLGRAFPCRTRAGGVQTSVGVVTLSLADIDSLEATGTLGSASLRAVGQAIGFGGSPWLAHQPILTEVFYYWDEAWGVYYAGVRANGEATRILGVQVLYPLELQSVGSSLLWLEASGVGSELMTPTLTAGANPLSTITVASFADLGYLVSYANADPFAVH